MNQANPSHEPFHCPHCGALYEMASDKVPGHAAVKLSASRPRAKAGQELNDMLYFFHMTKLLERAIAQVRELSADAQDMAAAELMRYLGAARDPQLSDDQLAEVRRRRAERNPQTLTLDELDVRLRRFGV
jgi:hypothetical protein